jgi:hypothetical protein
MPAHSTVETLTGRVGLHGVTRGQALRTTVRDGKAACPLDRVNRVCRAGYAGCQGARPCTPASQGAIGP